MIVIGGGAIGERWIGSLAKGGLRSKLERFTLDMEILEFDKIDRCASRHQPIEFPMETNPRRTSNLSIKEES
jgi:hypothetical protein